MYGSAAAGLAAHSTLAHHPMIHRLIRFPRRPPAGARPSVPKNVGHSWAGRREASSARASTRSVASRAAVQRPRGATPSAPLPRLSSDAEMDHRRGPGRSQPAPVPAGTGATADRSRPRLRCRAPGRSRVSARAPEQPGPVAPAVPAATRLCCRAPEQAYTAQRIAVLRRAAALLRACTAPLPRPVGADDRPRRDPCRMRPPAPRAGCGNGLAPAGAHW